MSQSRDAKTTRPVEITSSSSVVGQLLGDSLVGSCWRAVEQAVQPDVEVHIYVRSLAEAELSLDVILGLAYKRGLLKETALGNVDQGRLREEAKELGALVAISMNNGSVIVFKHESRRNR